MSEQFDDNYKVTIKIWIEQYPQLIGKLQVYTEYELTVKNFDVMLEKLSALRSHLQLLFGKKKK